VIILNIKDGEIGSINNEREMREVWEGGISPLFLSICQFVDLGFLRFCSGNEKHVKTDKQHEWDWEISGAGLYASLWGRVNTIMGEFFDFFKFFFILRSENFIFFDFF